MRQSSVIIHKGRKEEKYEIYIEDYALSFLKEETGTLDLSEFYFYGLRENDNKRYIIYGAGRNKGLAVFAGYSLLDEIGCRLTQAGPVFLVREQSGIYEIKGYEVFYQENKEMQSYLIDRRRESMRDDQDSRADKTARSVYADEVESNGAGSRRAVQNTALHKSPHSAISVQLGIILVALIAIVINSTNSYDKMNQLNQSASEVFFAIENQEAEGVPETDNIQNEIVVERNTMQEDMQPVEPNSDEAFGDAEQEEDVLKLISLENEERTEDPGNRDLSDTGESVETAKENQDTDPDEQEGVEALSRNVARYYEVERGDTLYTISRKIYGDATYVQKICELNQITDPDQIRYGQKIILP